MRRASATITAIALSGCGVASSDAGAVEQNGTAGNDVEVARLRQIFMEASTTVPEPETIQLTSRSPQGMKALWQCERREAGISAPTKATPVNYTFTASDDPSVLYVNDQGSFGRYFRRDVVSGAGLIGYAEKSSTSAIGEYQAVRQLSDGTLVMEQFKRKTVATLAPADEAAWRELAGQFDTAVSGGLATAYTHCTSVKRTAGDEKVVFYDDREDWEFTSSYSDDARRLGRGGFDEVRVRVSRLSSDDIQFHVQSERYGRNAVSFQAGVAYYGGKSVPFALPADAAMHTLRFVFAADSLTLSIDDQSATIKAPRSYAGTGFYYYAGRANIHDYLLK